MTLHSFTQQVCKATRLNLRTDSPLEPHKVITCITPFQENNPYKRKGPRNGQMGKKRNFIPKQNTHDSLVGTLSIGMPSIQGVQQPNDHRQNIRWLDKN